DQHANSGAGAEPADAESTVRRGSTGKEGVPAKPALHDQPLSADDGTGAPGDAPGAADGTAAAICRSFGKVRCQAPGRGASAEADRKPEARGRNHRCAGAGPAAVVAVAGGA